MPEGKIINQQEPLVLLVLLVIMSSLIHWRNVNDQNLSYM